MLELDPDWRAIVNELYARYPSYSKLQDALSGQGAVVDHATLSRLRSGKCRRVSWRTGAALLNLYGQPISALRFFHRSPPV